MRPDDLPLSPEAFAARVLAWFEVNGRRDLPWQQSRDPYRIWVSEIMLQQTQVATVIPYYERFMTRFPDVASLAAASLDEVLRHWSGLGYYARGRNLHRAAQWVMDRGDGRFPTDIETLRALPGVGLSTAAAVAALATGAREAILDGNVKRVLCRFLACDAPPGARRDRALWAVAAQLTPAQRADAYTQAMMDLGATCCTPRRPRCAACPLQSACRAAQTGQQEDYPRRSRARAVPEVALRLLAVTDAGGRVWLERRPPRGIWGGMWCLPECPPDATPLDWCTQRFGMQPWRCTALPEMRHVLTHRRLRIQPWRLELPQAVSEPPQCPGVWYPLGTPPPGGMVRPVMDLLAQWPAPSASALAAKPLDMPTQAV